jgi:flagellar motor switch protein FliN/FliY
MNDTTDTEQAEESTDDWAAAMAEQAAGEPATGETTVAAAQEPAETEAYQTAQFDDLQPDAPGGSAEDVNLDVILDIPVNLSMEIGRTRIPIRNLLQLNQGSVVELDRLAGEPMDVLVNGTLIAHGEVVVVNEKFGIRLTDVVSPAERVKKLK